MIVTRPRDHARIMADLEAVHARRVFVVGCGECAAAARTGGEPEVVAMRAALTAEGYEVTGAVVPEVTCNVRVVALETRRRAREVARADAVIVLACGAGVQAVADRVTAPVFPGLESEFLGTIVRHGVFEERCQMCGECVLDTTGGICPATACPKGLLNGPCGGMWDGLCDVVRDRECVHVRIRARLAEQGRGLPGTLPPKDHSKKLRPGSVDVREKARSRRVR